MFKKDGRPNLNTAIWRSKKRRFAFQTFTETPATAPSILGFGITHQPHEGGDGAKCGAKFADTPCVIFRKASGACPQKEVLTSQPALEG